MNLIRRQLGRSRSLFVAVALIAGSAGSVAVGLPVAAPANAAAAALTGGDWAPASLPGGNYVADGQNGQSLAPVSCTAGSQFCLAITSNLSVTGPNNTIGQSDVVTTDGGQSWAGYTALPATSFSVVSAVSCPSASICWIAGAGPQDQPEVAESSDGGQTWTLQPPADWAAAPYSWWPNAIDCPTTTTCWLAGETANSSQNPVVAETTDGGATWTTFTNLPTITPYDPNGTYLLNAISCTSALSCVAGGGLNEWDGQAQVISTTDGGATWTLSTDPTLSGIQQIFSLSCLPGPSGLATCSAAADSLQAAGPVVITSTDGGATWSGMETYDNTGWMNSISCADAADCWAAGSGTSVALVGTSNGGSTWAKSTSDTTNEDGSVSCATVAFCVATTDNALWVTTDNGGLPSSRPTGGAVSYASASTAAAKAPISRSLPHVSGATVSARAGKQVRVTGQYRGIVPATTATATITPPNGAVTVRTVSIGLNGYYSADITKVARGTTTVKFKAGNAAADVVRVHGYSGNAPRIGSLSSHAGPLRGGTTLIVDGANFSRVTAVNFGTRPGARVHVFSQTKLSVVAPKGTGAAYLTVITKNGGPSALTGRAVFNYLPAPALSRMSPRSGRPRGGNTVTIWGSGLAYVRSVYFGHHPATGLRVLSAREIKVTVPAGSGKVRVRIVTAGGESANLPADVYSY